MGLVDEIRNRRDSWSRRLEEQRASQEPYDHEFEKRNVDRIEEGNKKEPGDGRKIPASGQTIKIIGGRGWPAGDLTIFFLFFRVLTPVRMEVLIFCQE